MTYVVVDIETAKNDRADAYFAQKTYEPAANLKDPVKIAQSIEDKRARDIEKAALHWWTGRVICIGVQTADETRTFSGEDEKAILAFFFNWMPPDTILIAKSGDFFDMPFMVGRTLAHDLGVPHFLRPMRTVLDVDHIFSFSSACDQRSSLANYAWGLGIPGKTADGSDVAKMYEEKRWTDIEAYCLQDAAIAHEMLRRWTKPYPKGVVASVG